MTPVKVPDPPCLRGRVDFPTTPDRQMPAPSRADKDGGTIPPTNEACRAPAVPRETSSAIAHGMTARTPSPSPSGKDRNTCIRISGSIPASVCCTLGLAFLQDMIKHPSPDRPPKELASVGELDRPHTRYGTRGPGLRRASQPREVRWLGGVVGCELCNASLTCSYLPTSCAKVWRRPGVRTIHHLFPTEPRTF
jgi:hypothetical protein